MRETLTLRLSGGPTAPSRARAALRSLEHTVADLRDDVDLLVSELVTNSILHAHADHIELHATSDSERVRIEVSDLGPGFDEAEARREPSLTGEGGYGLHIVNSVAHRWGVNGRPYAGVWFEIDREPSERTRRTRISEPANTNGNRSFREITHA
jgi:anti-sigma regulatory factor (Ser/Thr protein kinase)